MNEGNQFTGLWIPAEIWNDNELTILEKCVLSEIISLDNKQGCFASNDYLSKFFNMSKRNIRRCINDLVSRGYLESTCIWQPEAKRVNKRILKTKVWTNMAIPMDKNGHTGMDKNGHDITKIDNKVNLTHWRESFDEYLKYATERLRLLWKDPKYLKLLQQTNMDNNVRESFHKAVTNIWQNPDGWEKCKAKKGKEIDFRSIIATSINHPANKVKYTTDEIEKDVRYKYIKSLEEAIKQREEAKNKQS